MTHLQSGDAGLRELAGTEQIDALRLFASVTEPVSFGERRNAQHTNQLTALDRFVDAVRPDPPSRHWSEMLTKRFLADPRRDEADRAMLDAWFRKIGNAAPEIKKQMEKSPRLQGEAKYAAQLTCLAETGREALGFLATGTRAPADWKMEKLQRIVDAKDPGALIRFTFLDTLRALVAMVGN